ncbi:DHA2 family efflux MFS transporter permease subunit [Nocardia terpenica]|uniref:MFS transporter n=1 Tax=Nocardia terpenica TaxID=455432 RepID=UPI001894D5BC|nr:MFS transporter [Nocardia terpenica]MBF6064421.1 DHA2 family efflux MFS transporter permease subunit [Nocardia terpenica]MBF6106955.1 DHA2 family efflux MFS transporter permease subunit [Nocardia terpenica]MBF6114389.1 DHA2 family efflux MFS transporter permease subunit [Nocardia terpenica]MBF6121525.1 DHA2 family efflux MFS transporter permease subunit [Nocardia terpenica]MBF6153940.1 DHA2 family efflux MFS transporter permease subunit [Nocardia terpenica]
MLVPLCLAQFVCVLDDTIVNIALPSVQAELGFSGSSLQWVLNGYLLTFGGLLLLAGRASDVFVRRTLFLTGLTVFGLASLTCGLAVSPAMLVVSRIVQGIGAAAMSASALAILTATFTGPARARAFGVWGGLSGAAGAAGVLLGGLLTSTLSWRWVFLVNIPVLIVVAALVLRHVGSARSSARPPLDPLGAITITAGLGLLIFGIVSFDQSGWNSPSTLSTLAAAVVLLAAFLLVERKQSAPLVPLGVFARRNVTGGAICALLLASTMLGTFFFLSLYLQQVLGFSALRNGVAFLPFAIAVMFSAVVSSRLVTKVGFKPLLMGGFGLLAVALLWLAQIDLHGSYRADVLGPALIAGVGLGTLLVGSVTATTHDLSGEGELGLASGLVTSTNQVGGALGLAILSTVAFARVDRHSAAVPESLLVRFQLAFYVAAGFALLGLLVSALVTTRTADQDLTEAQQMARH